MRELLCSGKVLWIGKGRLSNRAWLALRSFKEPDLPHGFGRAHQERVAATFATDELWFLMLTFSPARALEVFLLGYAKQIGRWPCCNTQAPSARALSDSQGLVDWALLDGCLRAPPLESLPPRKHVGARDRRAAYQNNFFECPNGRIYEHLGPLLLNGPGEPDLDGVLFRSTDEPSETFAVPLATWREKFRKVRAVAPDHRGSTRPTHTSRP
jgi:hypothetical protein